MQKRLPIKSWRTTTRSISASTSSIDRIRRSKTTSRALPDLQRPVSKRPRRRPSGCGKSVGRRRPAGCDPTPTRRLPRRRTKPTVKLEERRCICRRCGAGACTSSGATCPTATRSSSVRMVLGGRTSSGPGGSHFLAVLKLRRQPRTARLVARAEPVNGADAMLV